MSNTPPISSNVQRCQIFQHNHLALFHWQFGEALHRGALRRAFRRAFSNHRRASSSRVNRRHKERR